MTRRLACAFVDDVEHAGDQSLHFVGGAADHVLLDVPGGVAELCIWVSVEARADQPLRRLALSLWAHGREVDWITYEDAAVAPPEGRQQLARADGPGDGPEGGQPAADGASYTVDHIFAIPHHLTYRACVFEVRAASELGAIGSARLTLEFPPPF